MIRPGEIYYGDPGYGRRPLIIVSRENLNRGDFVVMVPCTTRKLTVRSQLPNYVPFRAGEFGLPADCVAQAEAVGTLDIQFIELEAGPVGMLDDLRFRDVIRAIGHVLDSDCEPV